MAIMLVCTAVLGVVQIHYHGYPKVGYQNFGNSFSPASGVPIPLVPGGEPGAPFHPGNPPSRKPGRKRVGRRRGALGVFGVTGVQEGD